MIAAVLLCLAVALPPDLLRSTNPNRRAPLWLSATAAVNDEGKLAPERFEPHERYVRKTCFGEAPAEIAAPSSSLNDLAKADTIVAGEITARTMGFFEGRPAALLSVRVDGTKTVFVSYPEADFRADGETHCIRPATHPARPRTGDRILIFAYGPPIDTSGRLLHVQASKHLIFETAGGELIPPVALRDELAKLNLRSIADVLAWLTSPSTPPH